MGGAGSLQHFNYITISMAFDFASIIKYMENISMLLSSPIHIALTNIAPSSQINFYNGLIRWYRFP